MTRRASAHPSAQPPALLAYLHTKRGHGVTLTQMRAATGLTLHALDRHIAHLQNAGYTIECHPRLGYTLLEVPDRLLPDEVQMGLNTRVIGREIITFERTSSTMDVAWRLAQSGAREGTVIFAEAQTRGRGRMRRAWLCPEHSGVLMSVILRPRLRVEHVSLLTITAAIAAADAIQNTTGLVASIKWPNDLVFDGRKVGGILVEAQPQGRRWPVFVLGLGLNVNIEARQMPREIRKLATSLQIEKGERLDRIAVARAVLASLDQWYALLRDGAVEHIAEAWRARAPMLGQRLVVDQEGMQYRGTIIDFSPTEGLILRLENGGIKALRGEQIVVSQGNG